MNGASTGADSAIECRGPRDPWVRAARRAIPALALLVATGGAPPAPDSETCEPTMGQQVVELLNALRAENGLGALAVDVRLVAAATKHTADMVEHDFMAHEGSDGSEPGERLRDAGYDWRYFSENVAAGQMTAAWAVDSWMNSAGHRANILSDRARSVGVAYGQRTATRYGYYWTTDFGATDGAPRSPPGGCHP